MREADSPDQGDRPFTDGEDARAIQRDRRAAAQLAWRAMGRLRDGKHDKRFRECGNPFGKTRHEPSKGIYTSTHHCVACGDGDCPRCGLETWLVRWAKLVLASAAHVASGGFLSFVSMSGQRVKGEPLEESFGRLCRITDWMCDVERIEQARWKGEANIVKFVRVLEPTFGGRNGVNPNAHFVFFHSAPIDGERPQDTAESMRKRILGGMCQDLIRNRKAKWFESFRVDQARFFWDEAIHCRLAGVGAASYITHLADGSGLSGLGSEMTDPTGQKRGNRNVGPRALPFAIADAVRKAGYGPRSWDRGIREVPRAKTMIAQYLGWRELAARKNLWTHSREMFKQWDGMSPVDLIKAAVAVTRIADPNNFVEMVEGQLAELIGNRTLVSDEDEEADEDDAAGKVHAAFTPGVKEPQSVRYNDRRFFRTVTLDAHMESTWARLSGKGEGMGGVDGAVNRLLDRFGAWGALVEIGETHGAARCTIYEASDGDLLLTGDRNVPPGWAIVPWSEAIARADESPTRTRAGRVQLTRSGDHVQAA